MAKLKLYCDLESFKKEWLGGKSETLFLFPFLFNKKYKFNRREEFLQHFNENVLQQHEHSRFKELIEQGDKYIELTSVEDCDFIFVPFKWSNDRNSIVPYIELANHHNKKILMLFEDDYSGPIPLEPDEGIILRTSIYKSKQKPNEYALPPFRCDRFKNVYIKEKSIAKTTVGFCGFFGTHGCSYIC